MFLAIVLLAFPVVSLTADSEPPGGYYTTRYDHLDVENILNQKRLVLYYAACLLEKGPCTPQGIEFKNILPEAIKTNCLRCTEKQRVVTTRSIRRLQKEYPDIWAQLEKKWDPVGENVKRLLASVNKPKPVPSVPLVSDRFGENDNVELLETTSKTMTMTSTTVSSIMIAALQTKENLIESTTPTPKPTSKSTPTKQTSKFVLLSTPRPFNSIGPNLIIPNPKVLIDKVIQTANMVISTVFSKG